MLGQIEPAKCRKRQAGPPAAFKSAGCSLRLPRIMLKETSYDGDTWPNPRHKLHRRASRWPALRAVGELPRSNRIRSKDQTKPMLFWRLALHSVFRRAHQAREEAMQRGSVGVGRQQSCCGPDTVVAPCKFMPCCRPGKGFVRSSLPFGPHKTAYGAAWLRQLPSRGTNFCWAPHSFRWWGRGRLRCHFIASSVHLLRNIPLLRW